MSPFTRADAPPTLAEQEQDVYACLCNARETMARCQYQHADSYEMQTRINEMDNLLARLEQVAEDRQREAA